MKVKTFRYPQNVLEWIDNCVYSDYPPDLGITVETIVLELAKDNKLSERDTEIFYAYFKDNASQAELAERYQVTRERLRQIINDVCGKINALNKEEFCDALHNGLRRVITKLCENNARLQATVDAFNSNVTVDLAHTNTTIENQPISVLGLSTRTYNALSRKGLRTVRDIIEFSEPFASIAQLGVKSYRELDDKFASLGLEWNGQF